ncbi:MAG: mechanosensitive ion channel domain-containing protein [Planctomycetota bacterium]
MDASRSPAADHHRRSATLALARQKLSGPIVAVLLSVALSAGLEPITTVLVPTPPAPTFPSGVLDPELLESVRTALEGARTSVVRERVLSIARPIVTIVVIGSIAWFVLRLIDVVQGSIVARFRIDVRDNLKARRVHTQTRVLARTADLIVILIAAAAILYLFDPVRQLGTALLASAGVAGLVIGMAARPVFENLIAGLQIALTQPINLDDAVIIEGEWGWVETIGATYVVIKIWDDRRLVVPLSHFINTPFQNWTKQTSHLLGTVFLHVDYRMSIDALRAELARLLRNTELWDERVELIQVTDAKEQTVELRVLVSAESSPKLWDLRCYVREGLVRFLQREHPESLPRLRASVRELDPAELDDDARFTQRFRERNFGQESGLTQEGLLPDDEVDGQPATNDRAQPS